MGLKDSAPDQSSANRRQLLPFFSSASDSSPAANSEFGSPSSLNNSNPQDPFPPSAAPSQSTPTPTPTTSPDTTAPTTPNAAAPSPTPPSSPSTPGNSAALINGSTSTPPKQQASPSPGPSPSPTSSTPLNSANPSPTPVASPQNTNNNATPSASPIAVGSSRTASLDPAVNTATPTVGDNTAHPFATPHRNSPTLPTGTSAASVDNSSGLSGGAITGIAIVAGIIGFILLFWVGVQMLQSKRRKREEAEMQEIDFYPGGGGRSVNGGMSYPRATGSLDRQPSASNSFNYNKSGPAHSAYGEGIHEEGEYIEPHANANQDYESGLQRQGTLGSSSNFSTGFYNNQPPAPPAPYTNYAPYSHQYGMQPPQPVYEPRAYEYPAGRAVAAEYPHGYIPNNAPTSIEYQR